MLVSALAIAAVGAGCGSSDDEALTKAEFTQQANAICKQGDKERFKKYVALIKGRGAAAETMSIKEGEAELGEELLIPLYQSRVEELGDLAPPSGDEEQVAAILEALEEGIEEGKKSPELLPNEIPAVVRYGKLAAAYGLKCDV